MSEFRKLFLLFVIIDGVFQSLDFGFQLVQLATVLFPLLISIET